MIRQIVSGLWSRAATYEAADLHWKIFRLGFGACREVGFADEDVTRMMGEMMGAFDRSKEEGQAQWKKTRQAVLRRHWEAEALAKAEQVEAGVVTSYTERRKRSAPIVAERAAQHYEPGAVPS